jgi:hypothetical protein
MPPLADTKFHPEEAHSAMCAFTSSVSDFESARTTIFDIRYSINSGY